MRPEITRYLEIIALMAGDIDKRVIAGKGEKRGTAGTDSFF